MMSKPRGEKKSEKLEVRLSHSEKRALQLEAQANKKTVSELVRQVLKQHIANQPYFEAALKPVRRHPKTALAGMAALFSAFAASFAIIPHAQSETYSVELLGKIESADKGVGQVSRFSSNLELNEDGTGTYHLLNGGKPFDVLGANNTPHRIEVTLSQPEVYNQNKGDRNFLLSFRIVELNENSDEVVAEPSVVVSEDKMANLDVSGDAGIRYTITAQVVVRPQN